MCARIPPTLTPIIAHDNTHGIPDFTRSIQKPMWTKFKHIDRLLRGDATDASALRYGTVIVPARDLLLTILTLGLIYGVCMASYIMASGADSIVERVVATMLKVPALFLLTLFITFPSLYAFNALVGSRLTPASTWRLLISTLTVMMGVLASLGPIVAFFSVSTTSYPFMLLLNVAVFATAGILGSRFLMRTLERLHKQPKEQTESDDMENGRTEPITDTEERIEKSSDVLNDPIETLVARRLHRQGQPRLGPLDREKGDVRDPKLQTIFRIWVVVFGLVGSQLSWVMRPFVGDPAVPFEWFASRESSFFEAIWHAWIRLLH